MTKPIRFTYHAQQKIDDLAEMGFEISADQVIAAIREPDLVDTEAVPPIAQKGITERHVIRVVFVEEDDAIRVVTFYPGRRSRYEPQDEV